jgi:hypothetical protein
MSAAACSTHISIQCVACDRNWYKRLLLAHERQDQALSKMRGAAPRTRLQKQAVSGAASGSGAATPPTAPASEDGRIPTDSSLPAETGNDNDADSGNGNAGAAAGPASGDGDGNDSVAGDAAVPTAGNGSRHGGDPPGGGGPHSGNDDGGSDGEDGVIDAAADEVRDEEKAEQAG